MTHQAEYHRALNALLGLRQNRTPNALELLDVLHTLIGQGDEWSYTAMVATTRRAEQLLSHPTNSNPIFQYFPSNRWEYWFFSQRATRRYAGFTIRNGDPPPAPFSPRRAVRRCVRARVCERESHSGPSR
jgi:hypothetical protein